MKSFGFISLNPAAENSYFTEVAQCSSRYGMECFRFKPTKIDPVTHLVSGEKYHPEHRAWQSAKFPIPEILYDRCFYQDNPISKTSQSIVNWLKKRKDLCFLGNGLPNKWRIYEILSQSSLKPYIPKTIKAESPQQVLAFLAKRKKVILKPTFGSGGMGIACLEAEKDEISVLIEKQQELFRTTFPNKKQARLWIENLLKKKEYISQPFLPLSDSLERPFDLRLFLQKNGEGSWVERGRGVRIGQKQGILSNLRAGADTEPFQTWVDTLKPTQKEFLLKEISDLSLNLTTILEEALPPLFELGIDIGVAKDLSLWILDVNSKPGRKVVLETTPEATDALYSAPLEYGRLLTLNHQKEGNSYEKTLPNRRR
jgi:glutathione synthase/RimK-type ligase-like ATP-grasp enzyme